MRPWAPEESRLLLKMDAFSGKRSNTALGVSNCKRYEEKILNPAVVVNLVDDMAERGQPYWDKKDEGEHKASD